MNIDDHESFRRLIDESLSGELSSRGKQSLREHLETCDLCQEYSSVSNRVIAGLKGFSFEVDSALNAKVFASLRLRAQPFQSARPSRSRWALISIAAVVLTMGGSFVDLQFGNLMASLFAIQRTHLQQGILAFWIAPSLGVLLLFPLLPLLSKARVPPGRRSI